MTILWGFFSVFPANAGMIPKDENGTEQIEGVPRECGDDPYTGFDSYGKIRCSPRMRG